MSVSKRERRYIEMAIDIASSSDNSKFRHGAILVKNGQIAHIRALIAAYCKFLQANCACQHA